MKTTGVVYYSFLSISFVLYGCCLETLYPAYKQKMTWEKAKQYCYSKNGTLASHGELISGISESVFDVIDGSDDFWIGEYQRLSDWIHILGCYTEDNILKDYTVTKHDFTDELTVGRCQEYCYQSQNAIYFGIQISTCFCLEDFIPQSTTPSSARCDTTCKGELPNACGAVDFINMYKTTISQSKTQVFKTTEVENEIECEGKNLSINCQQNEYIVIKNAIYGRKNNSICEHRTVNPSTTCNSDSQNVTIKLQKKCRNSSVCTVKASNANFGDPCRNIFKYLSVNYTCEPKTIPDKFCLNIECTATRKFSEEPCTERFFPLCDKGDGNSARSWDSAYRECIVGNTYLDGEVNIEDPNPTCEGRVGDRNIDVLWTGVRKQLFNTTDNGENLSNIEIRGCTKCYISGEIICELSNDCAARHYAVCVIRNGTDLYQYKVLSPEIEPEDKLENILYIAVGVIAGVIVLTTILIILGYIRKQHIKKTSKSQPHTNMDHQDNKPDICQISMTNRVDPSKPIRTSSQHNNDEQKINNRMEDNYDIGRQRTYDRLFDTKKQQTSDNDLYNHTNALDFKGDLCEYDSTVQIKQNIESECEYDHTDQCEYGTTRKKSASRNDCEDFYDHTDQCEYGTSRKKSANRNGSENLYDHTNQSEYGMTQPNCANEVDRENYYDHTN